ncbi:hypothetical protein DEIPH_ctg012orf0103 [Deinococcus phoenicis]|uniref:Uncharacterized protein n=1 Tax=Deinococcus phoenicis TaxID=1476583 RepID=A0A016QTE3_9DEIO|nr:hypothetical protein [Deinococcus phoenicis]EYB69029.1 hypothetical protein DEIPH_ctg012orf0103 [Deinococcus phoenicis]
MRYEYDARHDGAAFHLEDLHTEGACERLWRAGAGGFHALKRLRDLLARQQPE